LSKQKKHDRKHDPGIDSIEQVSRMLRRDINAPALTEAEFTESLKVLIEKNLIIVNMRKKGIEIIVNPEFARHPSMPDSEFKMLTKMFEDNARSLAERGILKQ